MRGRTVAGAARRIEYGFPPPNTGSGTRPDMAVSVFDLFKIGIGPSSSHTVGPMRAAARFTSHWLDEKGVLERTARVRAEVFGSLALTGRGHGTDKAVLMGLEGHWPNQIDPDVIPAALERIRKQKKLLLLGRHEIGFDEKHDLVMNKRQKLPFHTNGMRFTAYDADGAELATRDYYSVGGGFVVNPEEAAEDRIVADTTELPYPFHSGDELLRRCEESGLSIAALMLANETAWRPVTDILDVWFDSGAMPYAQVHYPFENRDWFESHYPGDFIVEYIGQTRGWFYTLHAIASLVFDKAAYKNKAAPGSRFSIFSIAFPLLIQRNSCIPWVGEHVYQFPYKFIMLCT